MEFWSTILLSFFIKNEIRPTGRKRLYFDLYPCKMKKITQSKGFIINMEVFTEFRLVFIVILAILGIFLILSLIPKGRNVVVTFFSVLTVSITHLLIATSLLVTENFFLDSYNLDGDAITFYLYLGIVVLAIVNPIVYKVRNKRSKRNSYSFR